MGEQGWVGILQATEEPQASCPSHAGVKAYNDPSTQGQHQTLAQHMGSPELWAQHALGNMS